MKIQLTSGRRLLKITAAISALALAICSASVAAEPERVIVLTNDDVSPINQMLADGWTVKHQSAAIGIDSESTLKTRHTLIVFTLTSPSAEVLAAVEAKRVEAVKAAFEKKRAEWLAKQPKVEKP